MTHLPPTTASNIDASIATPQGTRGTPLGTGCTVIERRKEYTRDAFHKDLTTAVASLNSPLENLRTPPMKALSSYLRGCIHKAQASFHIEEWAGQSKSRAPGAAPEQPNHSQHLPCCSMPHHAAGMDGGGGGGACPPQECRQAPLPFPSHPQQLPAPCRNCTPTLGSGSGSSGPVWGQTARAQCARAQRPHALLQRVGGQSPPGRPPRPSTALPVAPNRVSCT